MNKSMQYLIKENVNIKFTNFFLIHFWFRQNGTNKGLSKYFMNTKHQWTSHYRVANLSDRLKFSKFLNILHNNIYIYNFIYFWQFSFRLNFFCYKQGYNYFIGPCTGFSIYRGSCFRRRLQVLKYSCCREPV